MSLFGKRDNAASDVNKLAGQDDTVRTVLIFHKGWDISKQEEYVYKFHHQRLSALKPNQISISGIKLTRVEDDVIIVAFLRNSIDKAIRFDIVDLLLVDGDGKLLAKKTFDLTELGEIPALSSMPWRFLFEEGYILAESIPDEGWKIAFEWKRK
ncbi:MULTISPECIES: SLAP domain-containing protein [unclassified Bacillus (in: firmicutes)]|uniref:SLAP domain-containing protein n=1 Tax=unclassified Bacillus (in: firmicutes) TaxID=185979 RepID=UPI001BEAB8BB|nr:MULTISPECIES: SLAP domain-containing protein [unclassified Bacillus (in: firmicutes)]MBT2615056.1 SLAP domain-containing protein [Bacillus sp. ISL-78]MBT2627673.1 SLAP domain-containing protein [Bacillus sp. ISL-101]